MKIKLIIADDTVIEYFVEYMNTFNEYTVINKTQIPYYNIEECEEVIAVQKGTWLPQIIFDKCKYISIVNTEQLCEEDVKKRVNNELLEVQNRCGYKLTVYDYSTKNIEILNELGFNTKYHPYLSPPSEVEWLKLHHSIPKVYDVGFVGALNERRLYILNKLQAYNISVKLVQSFGKGRDYELAQCRYILNIHWQAHFNIFESIRCNRWLQAGFNVITEDSIELPLGYNLYSASYDNLVNTIHNRLTEDRQIDEFSSYIKFCYKPVNETEFISLDNFDINIYNKLKQDGIMIIKNKIDKTNISNGTDIINVGVYSILRKNYPYELDWLKNDGIICFNETSEPLYRRHIPPPIETIDHIFIISKIIMATSNKDKNYLEYGVRNGTSIEPISNLVLNAYAVDINNYIPQNSNIYFHKMLTNTFSNNNLKDITFDYAFIDADHSSKQVLIDFMHIYQHINKGGYIFLHDTYPCSEIFLRSDYCNDCYLSPIKIREMYPDIEMLTIPVNPGLTIIHKI